MVLVLRWEGGEEMAGGWGNDYSDEHTVLLHCPDRLVNSQKIKSATGSAKVNKNHETHPPSPPLVANIQAQTRFYSPFFYWGTFSTLSPFFLSATTQFSSHSYGPIVCKMSGPIGVLIYIYRD